MKSSGQVVVVNPALPIKTLQELVTYAKAHPGQVSYASSGFGTVQHLAGELFNARTGAALLHVPYRGGAPATNDLLGGHVQVMFDAIGNTLPEYQGRQAARARGAAREPRRRAARRADRRRGRRARGRDSTAGSACSRRARRRRDVLDKLTTTIAAAMADQELAQRLIAAGNDTDFLVGPALGERLDDDKDSIAAIVKAAGIQPDSEITGRMG